MAAAQLTRVIKGFQIWDKDGTNTSIDIFLASATPNGAATASAGSLCVDTTNKKLYINTDGSTTWVAFDTAGGSATEEGFIRAFIGKNAAGSETPNYNTSGVVGTVSWVGNTDNLELATAKLDVKVGAAFTPKTRTVGQTTPATETIMALLGHLDTVVGADSQMTSLNYIALAQTIYENLSALDAQVKTNADAITIGQHWREFCVGVTADTGLNAAANGTALSTLIPFSDDQDGHLDVIGDWSAGDLVLSSGATDKIFRVYDDAGTLKVTQADLDPVALGDTFLVRYYLPDPAGGENSAIVWYNGTDYIKIADVDWNLATGINLSGGYAAAGTAAYPASGDTVEAAIAKLHKDVLQLVTLSGVALGAADLGTFTGSTIGDNRTIKQALQDLETAVEAGGTVTTATGVGGTDVVLDTVPVASANVVHWVVFGEGVTSSLIRYSATVRAMNDGATNVLDVDESPFLKSTPALDIDISVDINAGNMRLLVNSDTAGGANIKAVRYITL
jgi:hypothetical protein